MDVAVLRGRIVATLDADTDVRRRAELDLKTVNIPPITLQGIPLINLLTGRRPPRLYRCASTNPTS
jgi:hypothetical protein